MPPVLSQQGLTSGGEAQPPPSSRDAGMQGLKLAQPHAPRPIWGPEDGSGGLAVNVCFVWGPHSPFHVTERPGEGPSSYCEGLQGQQETTPIKELTASFSQLSRGAGHPQGCCGVREKTRCGISCSEHKGLILILYPLLPGGWGRGDRVASLTWHPWGTFENPLYLLGGSSPSPVLPTTWCQASGRPDHYLWVAPASAAVHPPQEAAARSPGPQCARSPRGSAGHEPGPRCPQLQEKGQEVHGSPDVP